MGGLAGIFGIGILIYLFRNVIGTLLVLLFWAGVIGLAVALIAHG